MNKNQVLEIIKVICSAIIAVATILLMEGCTTSLNIQKHNTSSKQEVEQNQSTSIDSTRVEAKFNNVEK